MSFYEAVFIIKPEASASHVETVVNEMISIIKDNGGETTKTEFCGLRNLAYPIDKRNKGHYVLLNISIEPDKIKEFERRLKLNEDICRFLVVKVNKLDNNPSALMRRISKEIAEKTDTEERSRK